MIGTGEARCQGLQTRQLPEAWELSDDISATVEAKATINMQQVDASWHLNGSADARAHTISSFGITPEPITVEVNIQGPLDLPTSLSAQGLMRVHLEANDAKTDQLKQSLKRLGTFVASRFDNRHGTILNGEGWASVLQYVGQGTVSFASDLWIPLGSHDRSESLRGSLLLTSPELQVTTAKLRDVDVRAAYSDGVVSVDRATANVFNGREELAFSGFVHGAVENGGATITMDANDISPEIAIPLVMADAEVPRGRIPQGLINVSLRAAVPLQQMTNLEAWKATGQLIAPSIKYGGLEAREVSALGAVNHGELTVDTFRATIVNGSLQGIGTLNLKAPFVYSVEGAIESANLSQLLVFAQSQNVSAIAGLAGVSGKLGGTLYPLSCSGDGKGELQSSKVGNIRLGSIPFTWRIDEETAQLTSATATLFGGAANLSATYPVNGVAASTMTASLGGADLGLLSRGLRVPFRLSGSVSAEVQGSAWHLPDQATGSVRVVSDQVMVQEAALRGLDGRAELVDGKLTLNASAETLGGRLDFSGDSTPSILSGPLNLNDDVKDRLEGILRLREFPVERLLQVALLEKLKPFSGSLDATLRIRLDSSWQPHGEGQCALRDVRWLREQWSRESKGKVTFTGNSARLEDFQGDFAGGRARVNANIGTPQRQGTFRMAVEGASASKLLAPIPALKELVQGRADVRLQGTFGKQWNGRGTIAMRRATILSLPVTRIRIPLDFSFSTNRPRLRLVTSNTRAQVARGQVAGRFKINWGRQLQLNADMRGRDIELQSLLRRVPGGISVGSGRISGTARLGGHQVKSVNDLTGRFDADLSRVQPLQFPVLSQISRFVGPVQPTTLFETGNATGRLRNGTIYLQRATIDGGLAQLMIEGETTLRGGLDLAVTAKTGNFSDAPAALTRLARSPLLLAAPSSVSLLADANEFLSDRLVYLHVGGTIQRPSVRVQPARQLRQEAVRFFLRRATSAAIDN